MLYKTQKSVTIVCSTRQVVYIQAWIHLTLFYFFLFFPLNPCIGLFTHLFHPWFDVVVVIVYIAIFFFYIYIHFDSYLIDSSIRKLLFYYVFYIYGCLLIIIGVLGKVLH